MPGANVCPCLKFSFDNASPTGGPENFWVLMQPSKGGPFRSLKMGPSWKIHLKKKRIQLSKKFNSILTAVLIFLRHPKKTNAGSIVQCSLSLIPLIDAMRAQRRFPQFPGLTTRMLKKNIYQNGPIALPFLLPADLTYKAKMENTPIFLDIYLWRLYGNTRKGGIPAQVCHAKLLDGLCIIIIIIIISIEQGTFRLFWSLCGHPWRFQTRESTRVKSLDLCHMLQV